jgi:hypothetical protein
MIEVTDMQTHISCRICTTTHSPLLPSTPESAPLIFTILAGYARVRMHQIYQFITQQLLLFFICVISYVCIHFNCCIVIWCVLCNVRFDMVYVIRAGLNLRYTVTARSCCVRTNTQSHCSGKKRVTMRKTFGKAKKYTVGLLR